MSRRTIFVIIGLMTFALIGLVSFQLYWINNAIRLNREQFERDVHESLRTIAERLERNELMDVASKSAIWSDQDASIWISSNDTLRGDNAREEIHYEIDTIGNRRIKFKTNKNETEVFYSFEDEDSVLLKVEEHRNITATVPDSINKGRVVIDVTKLNEKSSAFNVVVKEMLRFESDKEHRVHPQVLDSMLHDEFAEKGIHITYEFGIFNENKNDFVLAKTADRDILLNSDLRANLFPNDLLGNVNYLMVNFPNQESFLFKQIWATLATSIILIGVIIFCFVYAIYTIMRQKKLSEIKNDFINNMTHEFKTPIATVSLACEALQEDVIVQNKETYARYLRVISDETSRLGSQVEKVLQAATLDKKDFRFFKKEIDLIEVINRILENFKIQVINRGGHITMELEANHHMILGDEMHISNALQNLLDNAVKYSPKTPEITFRMENPNPSKVVLTVLDNGAGISKDALKHIFDKFYRVSKGNVHDVKGFGLGLSYVKSVVESHGGTVKVNSEPGKGSNFSIIIPTLNAG